jgi:hypothetical protein
MYRIMRVDEPHVSLAKAAPKSSERLPEHLRNRAGEAIAAAREIIETAGGSLPHMVEAMRVRLADFDRIFDERTPAATVENMLDEFESHVRGAAFHMKVRAQQPVGPRQLFGGATIMHHGV